MKKILISLIISLLIIFNIFPLGSMIVFATEIQDLIIDMSSGTLNINDLTFEQSYALDLMIANGTLFPSDDGTVTHFKNESGKELFYANWNTMILTMNSDTVGADNIIYTITDNNREVSIQQFGSDIFADYKNIIIKFGHSHIWQNDWASNDAAHWRECMTDDCDVIENSKKEGYAKHNYSKWTTTIVATEISTGIKERVCTVCGYKETEIIPVIEHIHNLMKVEEVLATYEEDGHTTYYTCTGCNKWFTDEAGLLEITDKESVKISKLILKESTNQTDKDETPQTGDDSCIELWIALMLTLCLGFEIGWEIIPCFFRKNQ